MHKSSLVSEGIRHTARMGKVTIVLLVGSTALLLVAFTKGMHLVQGGNDVMGHLYWALAALLGVLGANFFAMFHAAQSDRIIRELRAALATRAPEAEDDGQ